MSFLFLENEARGGLDTKKEKVGQPAVGGILVPKLIGGVAQESKGVSSECSIDSMGIHSMVAEVG